ncbi:hypothetical protein BGZ80_000346 [Entomortierella chlamydospora]|uniref:F-box domain-containing protein n=1 Tax=Entomortierella chlamydospora TaxID=101097 RepID=A0A9P6N258_9FUNG|nr:hypothetical protein BGZ79_007981 [Entomortierella chlamydospora]KAG0022388.1 hypothetical protein BGZ80_000346 [Entomortierella chlamydospora]
MCQLVLQFVPLWTQPVEYSSPEQNDNDDLDGSNAKNDLKFNPSDILACSQVSHFWREHALQVLYFVFNYHYLNKIPIDLLKRNSFRFRIFEDAYQLSTHVFLESQPQKFQKLGGQRISPLMQLTQLRLSTPISFDNLRQILDASPRLTRFEWSRTGWDSAQDAVIPRDIFMNLLNQKQIRDLALLGWELPWEELMLLLSSTPRLTKLRLSSMKRNLIGQSKVENDSISALLPNLNSRLMLGLELPFVLNVTELALKIERSTDDATLDLVRLCPRLAHLQLTISCLFEVNTLISNLQYMQKQSSPSLPWSLKSIDISVISSYSDDYFPLLDDDTLIPLINCAQWQPQHHQQSQQKQQSYQKQQQLQTQKTWPSSRGLVKFSADIGYLTNELVAAIRGDGLPALPPTMQTLQTLSAPSLLLPPPYQVYGSNLTDLDIRINYVFSPLNNVHMLRDILWSCRKLKRVAFECFCDFLNPLEAALLFCGFNEKGLADANGAWPCTDLRQLSCMGIVIPKDMDLIEMAAMDGPLSETTLVKNGMEVDTIRIEFDQEELWDQENYWVDHEGYDFDAWGLDERCGGLEDPALPRFATQVIAQVARLPKLEALSLNGTSYASDITLFRTMHSEWQKRVA